MLGNLQVAGLLLNEVKARLNGPGRRAGLGGRRVPWGGRVLLGRGGEGRGWDGHPLATS